MEQLPPYQALANMGDAELTEVFGYRDFFTYELDFAALVTATSAQSSFTIQSDSSFLWQYGAMFVDLAAAGQVESNQIIPLVSCAITDSGSGRQLSSANVPLMAQFGNGRLPFMLPSPRFFRSQTQVNVSLTNFSNGVNYNIKLSFIGTKFFKYAQS